MTIKPCAKHPKAVLYCPACCLALEEVTEEYANAFLFRHGIDSMISLPNWAIWSWWLARSLEVCYKEEVFEFLSDEMVLEENILDVLNDIEEGVITLTTNVDPQGCINSVIRYDMSCGGEICIYNDNNEWGYIDSIVLADGRSSSIYDIMERMPSVRNYKPSDGVSEEVYGLPGYMMITGGRWKGFNEDYYDEDEDDFLDKEGVSLYLD